MFTKFRTLVLPQQFGKHFSCLTPVFCPVFIVVFQLFDGHFDTTMGAKVDAKSYERIAERIGCQPEEITFLTDVPRGKHSTC